MQYDLKLRFDLAERGGTRHNLPMKQQKILIITKEDESSWKSCQHIVRNLIQSYQLTAVESQIEYLKVEADFSYYLAVMKAKKIKESKFDFIIWADHKPCSVFMLNALNRVYDIVAFEDKPKLLIHLFGDFVLDCLTWETALLSLNEYPVHLLVASEAQKKLVDKMFKSQNIISSVVPFPVNENIFNHQNHLKHRSEIREKIKIANDDIVILYTGRISFQKNVDELVNTFLKVRNFMDKKVHLLIAGPWDDILLPFLGIIGFSGSNFNHFNSAIAGKDVSSIKFLGDLEVEDLAKVYHASDLFVSFSTYNDEDYGMSAAEALLTGLPCVLSNWGGFSTFADYSKSVDLVSVNISEFRMKVDSKRAQKKLLAKLMQVSNEEFNKIKISEEAQQFLSLPAVSLKLDKIMKNKKAKNKVEFTPLFYALCSLFKLSPNSPFKDNPEVYKEIYGDYFANKI